MAEQDESIDERPPLWTGHVYLYSRDPQRAGNFFEKLGLRPVAIMEPFAVMEMRGGCHIVVRLDPEAVGRPADFDLMVDDLDASHEAWAAMGVTVSDISRDERAAGRIFTVTDPDGNTLVVRANHVVGAV